MDQRRLPGHCHCRLCQQLGDSCRTTASAGAQNQPESDLGNLAQHRLFPPEPHGISLHPRYFVVLAVWRTAAGAVPRLRQRRTRRNGNERHLVARHLHFRHWYRLPALRAAIGQRSGNRSGAARLDRPHPLFSGSCLCLPKDCSSRPLVHSATADDAGNTAYPVRSFCYRPVRRFFHCSALRADAASFGP